MAEFKVLLTTSGLGSRLGDVTNHTNKSLVRVGDKAVISHVVDSYPPDVSFVVTLGHFGKNVRDFLLLAHPDRTFEFVVVDKYDGPGSSLGYSMLQAQEKLQCPFIFHACDTIVLDKIPHDSSDSWIAGCNVPDSSQYRTLNVENREILNINEKGSLAFDFSYVGICKVADFKAFWHVLASCDFENSHLSDCHVLNAMILQSPGSFSFVEFNKWFDVGNVGALRKARSFFKCEHEVLDKSTESIYFVNDTVIKFFADEEMNKKRVARAKILGNTVPVILASTDNFYSYSFESGDLFSRVANRSMFREFLEWCSAELWKDAEVEPEVFRRLCYEFYVTKTKKRIKEYLAKTSYKDTPTVINGETVPSAMTMIDRLDVEWLSDGSPGGFHGDLILDNVIKTPGSFSLIDWRQDFAGSLDVGDVYYDLAKLNHNLTFNHDLVNTGMFRAETHGDDFICDLACNSRLLECKDILRQFINQNFFDQAKVDVLTAIIWLNMSPLHEHPLDKFLFSFGKYNLHLAMQMR